MLPWHRPWYKLANSAQKPTLLSNLTTINRFMTYLHEKSLIFSRMTNQFPFRLLMRRSFSQQWSKLYLLNGTQFLMSSFLTLRNERSATFLTCRHSSVKCFYFSFLISGCKYFCYVDTANLWVCRAVMA